MRKVAVLFLLFIAIACLGIALYYPITYFTQQSKIESDIEGLKALKPTETKLTNAGLTSPDVTADSSTAAISSDKAGLAPSDEAQMDNEPQLSVDATVDPGSFEVGTDKVDKEESYRDDPQAYPTTTNNIVPESTLAAVALTPEPTVLEECEELLALNGDYVGWLTIVNTEIDYPVLQTDDEEYYLTHDFYGEENVNGQLILDAGCDVMQPSCHLIISGHNMRSGKMFAALTNYNSKGYWNKHKTLQFNSIYRYGEYVIFAAFYSKDYQVDEDGFRYNVDVNYAFEMNAYLDNIDEVKSYDTGIDVRFGDELITLTTCSSHTEEGRFVVVARKVRSGETF